MQHWHTHSHYSTLDGLSKVRDIVETSKAMGAKVACITDHASIGSLPQLVEECKKADIKPCIGCEFYVVDEIVEDGMKKVPRYHFSVWAKTWKGAQSIMDKLTLANQQFFMRPILTMAQIFDFEDCMVGTACTFGILSNENYDIITEKLAHVYGDDLYLEVMPHKVILDDAPNDKQRIVNERAVEMSVKHGVKILATNDSHYTKYEDRETHKMLLAIQYRKLWSEWDGWDGQFHMRTIPEMATAFRELGYFDDVAVTTALMNSVSMADKVNIEMPDFEILLPEVHDNDERFAQDIVIKGWREKIKNKVGSRTQEYHERLIYELGVIKKMGFMKYFLMVEDIIRWSRDRGIMVGPGRGSAAGSLVCYLMGITQLDPILHGLYFERFLNPERVSMPDIDVDFQDNRRQEVFDYIVEKYGQENVGQITTFGYLTAKSAFRDVARAFDINHFKVNGLSKQIEDPSSFDTVPELAAFTKENPLLVAMAKELDGTIRQSGVHACGVCISSRPLREVCAVEKRKDVMVSSWDSSICEDFGLLKMDILGLTTLSILTHARQLVKKNYDIDIDYPSLPLDDPASMELFSKGDCKGIFQFEADQMQQLLRKLGARDFQTVTACTALHRPGPLQAGLTEKYVGIVQGKREENYPCPQLKPILGSTKSIIVYQEQVMRIFTDLGGFSMAHADKMRKIIGKKLGKDEFDKHREDFVNGCLKNDIPPQVSNNLFNDMAEFAAYSFNLAHAAAYTMLSVWSMYMKANYTAEFLAAYMSCVKKEDSVGDMVADSRKMNVPVTRPDINISTNSYELDGGAILAPLGAVKGVGEKAVASILEARKDGAFLSVEDMRERVNRRVVNVRVVKLLERAGAFERLGVKEPNEEQREKNYNELLPMLAEVPTMDLEAPEVKDEVIAPVLGQIEAWATANNMSAIFPEFGASPAIMAINMPMKGERNLLTKPSTKLFTKTMQEYGIKRKNIYYTSLLKCVHENPAKAKKKHISTGMEILKKEIEAIKPKLIVVFAAPVIPMFAPDGKMGKLNGRVVYNKVYDCYVMFSWSPQYAAYKTEEIGPAFEANMVKISEMFGVI